MEIVQKDFHLKPEEMEAFATDARCSFVKDVSPSEPSVLNADKIMLGFRR